MNTSFLYDYNVERFERLADRKLPRKDELQLTLIENGYLLPNRYAPKRLFGHGGVCDEKKQYVKESEMNAYAKYVVTPGEEDEREIYLGEGYEFEKEAAYIDEEVVYLGYLNNHWGHFLVDCSTRLYYYLKNKEQGYKYAFIVNEGESYVPIAPIKRFFELLGIESELLFVNQVTKCRKIHIPEPGYMINYYYSGEYLQVFDVVADGVDCSKYPQYEKVYYSRANFQKAKSSELGEDMLLNLFQKNSFSIISPEKLSLDEQIAIIRNAELLVGVAGTLGHNMLFAKEGQKMLLINKTHNLNMAQMDINYMRDIDMTYVDAYLAKYPVLIGVGPFFVTYSEKLSSLVKENGWKKPDECFLGSDVLRENAKIYEKTYRAKSLHNLELKYEHNKRYFDYFGPEHVVDYMEKTYALLEPATKKELLEEQIMRVQRFLKRIRSK